MSKEIKNEIPANETLPGWVKKAPELLPVWDWWVKEGRSTVLVLLVGAVCVGGWYAFKNWKAGQTAAAGNAVMNAFSADELEEAAAKFGSTAAGPALKLRLGKSYLASERWEEAEKVYAAYEKDAAKDDPFVSVAMLGRAYALEGAGKFDDAKTVYEILSADTNLPVHATAELGVARCVALKGDKEAAVKMLEKSDDVRAKNLIETIRRYDPTRKSASLFDAADSAAAKIESEKAVEAKPAEAKKPEAKPAEAKPAAEKAAK